MGFFMSIVSMGVASSKVLNNSRNLGRRETKKGRGLMGPLDMEGL